MDKSKQIMNTEQRIQALEARIKTLETMLDRRGGNFEELIRDQVFFDVDNTTTPTEGLVVPEGGGNFNIAKSPSKFARGYFRGKVYNFALYEI